jgi:transcriptional regulator GlxA family with amidase domain
VIFVAFPGCEILDLAGPLQAFAEANALGARYALENRGTAACVPTAQGLDLAGLAPLGGVEAGDLVLVPGFHVGDRAGERRGPPRAVLPLVRFLRVAAAAGARVGSVCTGAFLLGWAGLLDGRPCTTHWKRVAQLRREFPRARVLDDRLWVEDGAVLTSAGIVSGIDLALALIDEDHGPRLAARVARELVVYVRRQAGARQSSVYLDFRTHIDAGVHAVQDHLVAHPESRASLAELAAIGHTSARTLSRSFRAATGISVHAFRTRVRLEHASSLLRDPGLTVEAIASRCGFADARQLRRLWKDAFGASPRALH